MYSNREVTGYLLCEDCEGRLSRDFEHYISTLAVQRDGTFPWLVMANGGSAGDQDKIARFACSVVWRASVSTACRTQLGKKYEPMLADYLLRRAQLPDEVVVIVYLTTTARFHRLISFPVPSNHDGYHHHWFFANGAKFVVLVGNQIPPDCRELCVARTGVIVISNGDDLLQNFGEDIRDAVPKGKLKLAT